jgi:hypothetical protein
MPQVRILIHWNQIGWFYIISSVFIELIALYLKAMGLPWIFIGGFVLIALMGAVIGWLILYKEIG